MPKASRGGQRASRQSPSGAQPANYVPLSGSRLASIRNIRQQKAQQAAQQPAPSPTPTPSPAQVARGNIMPAGGTPFKTFETMTDDQKAKVISDALNGGVPMFLDNSGMQKFAYFTGMNDKPQVVSETQLNAMPGRDLWRSVHNAYSGSKDIGYSSNDIYNQLVKGDYTNYSDTGGSAHGNAIYFDISKGSYGSGRGYTVIHAKLAPGAKMIKEDKLISMYQSALAKGDKLAKACSRANGDSRENLYALAKGYDVRLDRHGMYHMVLNRRALIVSDKTF